MIQETKIENGELSPEERKAETINNLHLVMSRISLNPDPAKTQIVTMISSSIVTHMDTVFRDTNGAEYVPPMRIPGEVSIQTAIDSLFGMVNSGIPSLGDFAASIAREYTDHIAKVTGEKP